MRTAILKALMLIASGDRELVNILGVTARMSLSSSLIAMLIGVPLGILLGAYFFPGRKALVVIARTLSGMPPVVCGLIFYMLFSGVGPLGFTGWLFTIRIMILAQIVLITPIVISQMESYVTGIISGVRETAVGMGLSHRRILRLLINESGYHVLATYLLAFSRAIAEVGAVAMVGGAIVWKTNVMTTAIMQYTNRGDFTLGVALGIILLIVALIVNLVVSIAQRRWNP